MYVFAICDRGAVYAVQSWLKFLHQFTRAKGSALKVPQGWGWLLPARESLPTGVI